MASTLYPRANFLDVLDGTPDLYGPFWIATTVVVILFLTGTISAYLAARGQEHYSYDFTLLSGAAGLVYGYTAIIPLGLWGVLRWFGSESANLMECWALYGYANLIWIPVALVSWSPLSSAYIHHAPCLGRHSRAMLMRGGSSQLRLRSRRLRAVGRVSLPESVRPPPPFTSASTTHSITDDPLPTSYPVVSATDAKTSRVLLIVVIALHAGFAIAIKVLFFAHQSPAAKGGKAGGGAPDPIGDSEKANEMMRMLGL